MSQLPIQNLIFLHVPSIQLAFIQTLHCEQLTSDIMLPPKGVTDKAKATHSRSDVDIVTHSKERCKFCKKFACECDGTPFKHSARRSETLQSKQQTTDALSPFKKPAMQHEDHNPHPLTNSTVSGCPICKKHTCMCQKSRPGSRFPVPTDGGDRLCVICWEYGCTKHPKSN